MCNLKIDNYNIFPPMSEQPASEDQQFADFILAIRSGSIEQVEQILRVANPNIVNRIQSQFREPALYFSVLAEGDERSAELIKLLIRNGANINFKDSNQQTILFYVCREGKQRCAEILLSHGLNLDDTDVYGQTPMFYAVRHNRIELVRKYSTKQRVNYQDKLAGQTPLYYASQLQMAQLLIEKGADASLTDLHNKTAADYLKKMKAFDVAEYLTNQLKKLKELNKNSSVEESQKRSSNKRKQDIIKQARQLYKIVYLNEKGEPRDLSAEQVKQLLEGKPQLQKYISNPELIPEQSLIALENESWQKIATKILAQCSKLKGAYYFAEPVDLVKFNILDYYDIITTPMDLSTVRKKLTHNCYSQASQFIDDMNLIWINCYKYNGDQHVVSKCAKQLQNSFNELVQSQGLSKYLVRA